MRALTVRSGVTATVGRFVTLASLSGAVGLAALAMLACGPREQSLEETPARADRAAADEAEGTSSEDVVDAAETAGIEAELAELYADFGDVRYFDASVDLDGDGRDERVVHVAGPMVCGTGGCNTLVFTSSADGWKKAAEISVTRPPIQVSSRSSNGWRNLLVHVSGGGLGDAYDAELEFDGESYPSNPTVEPVGPAPDIEGAELLIAPFESFTEGKPITE